MYIIFVHFISNNMLFPVTETEVRDLTEEARVEGSISEDVLQMTDAEAQTFVAGWLTHKVTMNLYLQVNTVNIE